MNEPSKKEIGGLVNKAARTKKAKRKSKIQYDAMMTATPIQKP